MEGGSGDSPLKRHTKTSSTYHPSHHLQMEVGREQTRASLSTVAPKINQGKHVGP